MREQHVSDIQQFEMFSGALVDNRTARKQRQFEPQQAEAQTYMLSSDVESSTEPNPKSLKLETYLTLVQLAKEILTETHSVLSLVMRTLEAQEAGLIHSEIQAAVQVGEQQAIRQKLEIRRATIKAEFEIWLESDLGQEVFRRIMNNQHTVDMNLLAAYFDTVEDVQQKALIWLWERWQQDPSFSQIGNRAKDSFHRAAIITKIAVLNARCMYAKRRREGREKQTALEFEDGVERSGLVMPDFIRATDTHEHDRRVNGVDRRSDVAGAIEAVVERMRTDLTRVRTGPNGNGRLDKRYSRIPIEHITRTIIEGYMHHYTDRYSQTGTFRQFCEARGVGKNQISRWRPMIFDYLREELQDYMPEKENEKNKPVVVFSQANDKRVLRVRHSQPLVGKSRNINAKLLKVRRLG